MIDREASTLDADTADDLIRLILKARGLFGVPVTNVAIELRAGEGGSLVIKRFTPAPPVASVCVSRPKDSDK